MNTLTKQLDISTSVNHLFDEEVFLTGINEFGIAWEDLLSGNAEIPPQGARFILTFEGSLSGEKLKGSIKGTDYLLVRADGKFLLNLHVSILTNDGEMIFLEEYGVLTPGGNKIAKLHLNMQFSTVSSQYDWINKKQVWGIGEVDMQKGAIQIKGYSN